MTRLQLAKWLRQIVVVFWVFGGLAVLGFLMRIDGALAPDRDGFVQSGPIVVLVVELAVALVGLLWMGLIATALAELLEQPPHRAE